MANGLTLPFSENLPTANEVAFQITAHGVPKPPAPVITTTTLLAGIGEGQTQVTLEQAAISGATDLGIGIFGNAVFGCGVVGVSGGTIPVGGGFAVAAGVYGNSSAGFGVWGLSNATTGVFGQSTSFDAVVGETQSDAHAGVTGRNLTKGANGGAGIYGVGGKYAGKFDGNVEVNGVLTVTNAANNHSIAGILNVSNEVVAAGLVTNLDATIGKDLFVGGTVTVKGDVVLTNQDCAEDFDVALSAELEAGTVMVLDECGLLQESRQAYDKKVAGVISGAGEFKPGLILGRDKDRGDRHRVAVALIGKVYCKVDAEFGRIGVGDLLTTSLTPGHAMKAADQRKAFGATIGKALASLTLGRGLIPILVALQ